MGIFRKENGSLVKKAGQQIVDLALSLTSNKPVANRVITAEINDLKGKLGFIGSTAEINTAIQQGIITEGMLVYNTDDEAVASITAGQITYDNTGTSISSTSVQGAITELNSDLTKNYSFDSAVNIISADSVANAYEAPSDGIIFVRNTGTEEGNAYIYGVVGNAGVTLAVSIGAYVGCNVTIKKGTKLYAEFIGISANFRSAVFVPMV